MARTRRPEVADALAECCTSHCALFTQHFLEDDALERQPPFRYLSPRHEELRLSRGDVVCARVRLMCRRLSLRLARSVDNQHSFGSTARGRRDRGDAERRSSRHLFSRAGVAQAAHKRAMRQVALRDCGQRCVYCAVRLDQRTATLDHVVPRARGGAHDPGNLVVACAPCNRLKGELIPFEFFARHPWAGANFVRYARSVHRALKRGARRAVSLAFAREDAYAA